MYKSGYHLHSAASLILTEKRGLGITRFSRSVASVSPIHRRLFTGRVLNQVYIGGLALVLCNLAGAVDTRSKPYQPLPLPPAFRHGVRASLAGKP